MKRIAMTGMLEQNSNVIEVEKGTCPSCEESTCNSWGGMESV